MLQLADIHKAYRVGASPVLDGLNLSLADGEFLAIMGESGTGKSTLLNVIAGLERPDRGSVVVDEAALQLLDDDAMTRWRRRHMGFVFQAFHVLPYLTVLQNVTLPLELLGIASALRTPAAMQMLSACGIEALARRYPRELSGGELQRVAIARALIHSPKLLLADEPTGNLDARTAEQILRLLRERLTSTGASAILITHSRTAARTADRILQLANGRLAALEA
jgi:putative ABC transport system ATP-binding protein